MQCVNDNTALTKLTNMNQTLIGNLITGDFEDNTMTFEIEGDFTLKAGKYVIVEQSNYKQPELLQALIDTKSALIDSGKHNKDGMLILSIQSVIDQATK